MKFFKLFTLILFVSQIVSCKVKPLELVYESKIIDKSTETNETKIYILKKQTNNSDFNYSKLNNIDNSYGLFKKPQKSSAVFEPIKGKFNYYQFIATFKGTSYNDGSSSIIKDFHDILIVKTNTENQIIDAYQYTLEWAESPFQCDVYKSSSKHLKLTDKLDLEELKLTRTCSWNENDKLLEEKGIIKL